MIFKRGLSTYGYILGVLVFKGKTPRIPGDAGNALTFDVPVLYETVEGNFADLIDGSEKVKRNLIKAAKNLESQGVQAILGDCGLMSIYQKDVARNLNIPFISSSLVLLPIMWRLQGETGKIGVITGHSNYLKRHHLEACGAADIPIILHGMEKYKEFSNVVLMGSNEININSMRNDILTAASDMISKSKEIRSILLECSNLCSFVKDIRNQTQLPVFDLISAWNLVKCALDPYDYSELIEKYGALQEAKDDI